MTSLKFQPKEKKNQQSIHMSLVETSKGNTIAAMRQKHAHKLSIFGNKNNEISASPQRKSTILLILSPINTMVTNHTLTGLLTHGKKRDPQQRRIELPL